MRLTKSLLLLLIAPLVLGGCAAAVLLPTLLPTAAIVGGSAVETAKANNAETKGLVETAVDLSKVTAAHKAQFMTVRSIAVWPDWQGASVSLAEGLAQGGRFTVTSPLQVSAILKRLELSDNLKHMTANEAREAFSQVRQNTSAEAIIFTRENGQDVRYGMFVFNPGNRKLQFLAVVSLADATTIEIPVTVTVDLGHKPPSPEEIARLANAKLAEALVALVAEPAAQLSTNDLMADKKKPE